jgi:hypothetical protein
MVAAYRRRMPHRVHHRDKIRPALAFAKRRVLVKQRPNDSANSLTAAQGRRRSLK